MSPVVQTAYPNVHARLVAGQIVDPTNCDIDSMILGGSTNVKFSYGLRHSSGERTVEMGAERPQVALLNQTLNNSDTDTDIDTEANPYSELPAGVHYLIEDEIVYAERTSATAISVMQRGQLGTTAAAHSDNDPVYPLVGPSTFRGLAVQDERLRATNPDGVFVPGDVVPVLWRGDIAVEVSIAVGVGDQASVRRSGGSSTDPLGSIGNRNPSSDHVLIPGARFLTAAADNGIAVLRLTGEHISSPII